MPMPPSPDRPAGTGPSSRTGSRGVCTACSWLVRCGCSAKARWSTSSTPAAQRRRPRRHRARWARSGGRVVRHAPAGVSVGLADTGHCVTLGVVELPYALADACVARCHRVTRRLSASNSKMRTPSSTPSGVVRKTLTETLRSLPSARLRRSFSQAPLLPSARPPEKRAFSRPRRARWQVPRSRRPTKVSTANSAPSDGQQGQARGQGRAHPCAGS